jgi:tetratricopeptide (TPR) repeat protein
MEQAISHFREAIEARPDFAEAHLNLALALYLTGDYAGAWSEVRLSRKYGLEPRPDFLAALSRRMPEPSGVMSDE